MKTMRWRINFLCGGFLLMLGCNCFADAFIDTLTGGINSTYWIVRTNTGFFTITATGAGIIFSKDSGSVSNIQVALLASKLVAQGNFDVQVDFTNANLNTASSTTGNQLQLNTRFGGQDFLMVRSDEHALGQNAHLYANPPGSLQGVITWSTNAGTLRVVRAGTLVQGYLDTTLVYQNNYNTNDATFTFVLQNNAASDAIAATFKNFQLSADHLVNLPARMIARTDTSTNMVMFWPDTSWPDTLAGYTVQTATNLIGTIIWQTLTNQPTRLANQYFFTNTTSDAYKFFRLEQGPDFYH